MPDDLQAQSEAPGARTPRTECPFQPEQFPARARAIVDATDRRELVQACWRYAGARLWVRYSIGRPSDLACEIVFNDAWRRVSRSRIHPRMPKRCLARLVMAANDKARAEVEGRGC